MRTSRGERRGVASGVAGRPAPGNRRGGKAQPDSHGAARFAILELIDRGRSGVRGAGLLEDVAIRHGPRVAAACCNCRSVRCHALRVHHYDAGHVTGPQLSGRQLATDDHDVARAGGVPHEVVPGRRAILARRCRDRRQLGQPLELHDLERRPRHPVDEVLGRAAVNDQLKAGEDQGQQAQQQQEPDEDRHDR